mgnify:CR=1 FL=1
MPSIDDVIRLLEAARDHEGTSPKARQSPGKVTPKKAPRKASAYSKKYAKAFQSVKSKHMKKSGGWKKDGYKKAVKAAHAKAKRMK